LPPLFIPDVARFLVPDLILPKVKCGSCAFAATGGKIRNSIQRQSRRQHAIRR
jgi:hypothetical protein